MENDRNAVNRLEVEGIQHLRIDVIANKHLDAASHPNPSTPSIELPSKTTSRPRKAAQRKVVEAEEETAYVPRWNSSLAKPLSDGSGSSGDDESSSDQLPSLSNTDELPHFADEESVALHNEIKHLEQRRDEAARLAKSQKERTDIIKDHLQSIRQEIDHTNSLVAAKRKEIDTEEHLVALSGREVGQCSRECSKLDEDIVTKQKAIKRAKSEVAVAEDELEKLKTDLNWNQEELEQWVKAATKKEEENLAMQKYTSVDDLKIKELALVIEDLTKLSVEKKSMLENEVTETRSSQTELDKLAERFKTRHDERRQLIRQWKYTIESMNKRDAAISEVATQYADFVQKETNSRNSVKENKEQYELLRHESEDSEKDIQNKERSLQAKRQELSSLLAKERSLSDEINSLKGKNTILAAAVESKRAEEKRAIDRLEHTQEHVEALTSQLEQVKNDLSSERDGASSKERVAEEVEALLAIREKELDQAEKRMASLKQKIYKDSQKLSDLRKQEADLIAEVKGAQANIKNYASKISELEQKRARQGEILDNVRFQLAQVEKKVARGLGIRSNEEQIQLKSRIEDLEKELERERQKKTELLQQQRKLTVELRSWNKKHDNSQLKYDETVQKIDYIGLEIFACETSLKEIVSKKEETMVSRDVLHLDVRRLRDSLRDLLEELCAVEKQRRESKSIIEDKKDEAVGVNEAKRSELRTSKDDHHKAAMDLGKVKLTLEKTKSKYETVRSANASKGNDYKSPELKLILAAQRREELQQEGDKLDETIMKKENEILTMKQTLEQLKDMNRMQAKIK
ncbi:hypothetical protein ACHAXM_007821 [Skeletonema potamos]